MTPNASKLYANYHTHTERCHHAQGSEREMIETAIASGLSVLGFSDHAPMLFSDGFVSDFRMLPEQAEEYTETLLALRAEYAKDIRILIGYEMEYYPRYFYDTLAYICRYPVDYLILGQHFIENEFPYDRVKNRSDGYSGAATAEEWKLALYVDRIIEGISTGAFSYIAHPDLIRWTGAEEPYCHHITRLCRAAVRHDIPLEINLAGLRAGIWYPAQQLWQIAAREGCRAILGCDAHSVSMLADAQAVENGHAFAARFGLTLLSELPLRDVRAALEANRTPQD